MNETHYIEKNCDYHFEGRTLTCGGAVITDGYVIAYPGKRGVLNDWHGKPIGTYWTISSRPAVFSGRPSHIGSRYYYMRAVVNGRRYSLRGFGEGMIARGRALKS